MRTTTTGHSTFGGDRFGQVAEAIARFFGTWQYIAIQTALVVIWMAANAWLLTHPFDRVPFIMLNLVFSTQAAYAAPLILLAQTRQADRDKALADDAAAHREEVANAHARLLAENTRLTQEVRNLIASQK